MKDRTVKQLHAVLNKYVKKWKTQLFLGVWEVSFNIRDYLKGGDDGTCTAATCDAQWKYFEAFLNFSFEEMRGLEEEEIEKIVIHEMMHIVVNELREEGIDHEERVVSHLTMIADWMDKR